MGIGTGLSATLGIVQEVTPGTPLAVTRFTEFNKETMSLKKATVQGAGLRGGTLFERGIRRGLTSRQAAGTVGFDLPVSNAGLWLQQMFGSYSTTPTSLGGGLYQQIHNTASLQGKAFTMQILKPDYTGVFTQNAYTYTGCKVTDWTISGQTDQQLQLELTVDAINQFTPSDAFAGTTLSSSVSAAATSIVTVATIVAGSYILIGTGLTAEVLVTGTPTGSGPFTIPIVGTPVAYAHASGSAVTSPTATNYGSPAALQAATYSETTTFFYDAAGSSLIAGGSTSVVSSVWTNTGGSTVGGVRSFSLKGTNPLNTNRFTIGSQTKSEQLENGFRNYTLEADVEYGSPYFYQNYTSDTPLALVLKFTNPRLTGSYIQFYIPVAFQDDGTDPEVGGPDLLIPKLSMKILDDGVNGAFQCVLAGPDSSV